MDPSESSSTSTLTVLKNIVPAAENNINTKFILLEKGKVTIDSRHHHQKTCLALVADETASVHFQLWGHECHVFVEGDIILLSKGIFSNNSRTQSFTLRAGQKGKVEKIGEFTMPFVETPNLSEIHWLPDASNNYVKHSVVSPYSRIFSRSQYY